MNREAVCSSALDASREKGMCRFFGICGGCLWQNLDLESYKLYKTRLVITALQNAGVEFAQVEALFCCAPQTRRRVTLTAERIGGKISLGYHRYHSHEVVSIDSCLVVLPVLIEMYPLYKRLVSILLQREEQRCQLHVLAADNGLDIAITAGGGALQEEQRQALLRAVLMKNVARLTVDGELISHLKMPLVHFGDVAVELPPGAFLQATERTERHMVALALRGLKKAKKIVDLFCGLGTFTFPLAKDAFVHAVEADHAAINALEQAAKAHCFTAYKPITTEQRDLFSRPLSVKELSKYDGLIFDPPRAGAQRQVLEIAKSCVPFIVAVSCHPETLARDLKILQEGGYKVTKVFPIDQFLWSDHCEVVVFLQKRAQEKSWRL